MTDNKKDKKHSAGIEKRMQNLVQYSKKKTKKKEEPEEIDIETLDIGSMSVNIPKIGDLDINTIPVTVLAVLNKTELKLYIKEVSEWALSHPDWDKKEDIDDINSISMEKVLQYRLLTSKKKKPGTDIEKDYNSSVYRTQTFRQNLSARRTDRLNKNKGGGGSQTNIAIIAGALDEEAYNKIIIKNNKEKEEEEVLFQTITIEGD